MASVIALRALLGAGLGLGALDLVWINVALAPRLVQHETAPIRLTATASSTPSTAPLDEPPAAAPTPTASIAPSPVTAETVNERVFFATNSAALDARARKALAKMAELASPTAVFVLEGHADYRGDEARNKTLSKDRAVSVQEQLVQLGIARARIRVGYVGEGEATGQLWRDRRVEIQLTGGTR